MNSEEYFSVELQLERSRCFHEMRFMFDLGRDSHATEEANHISIWLKSNDKEKYKNADFQLSKGEAKQTIRILEAMVKMLEDEGH